MRLTQKIWCSQAETIVSYSTLLLSLSNYEIIIVSNIIYSLFTLLQSLSSSGNAHFKTKVCHRKFIFFHNFQGKYAPIPPLRMVMPAASHLKVKMQMKISDMKVAKGCGFYRIVWVPPECPIWLLTFNTLRHWYSYSPHCSLYISYGTDKENLSKKYIW